MKPHQKRMCPVIERMVGEMKIRRFVAARNSARNRSIKAWQLLMLAGSWGRGEVIRCVLVLSGASSRCLVFRGVRVSLSFRLRSLFRHA